MDSIFTQYRFYKMMNEALTSFIEMHKKIPGIVYKNLTGSDEFLTWCEKIKRAKVGLGDISKDKSLIRVTEKNDSRLYNIVKSAAAKMGEPMPAIYIKKDKYSNAWCNRNHRAITFTAGQIKDKSDGFIEHVAGHEISHFNDSFLMESLGNAIVQTPVVIINKSPPWLIFLFVGYEYYKHSLSLSWEDFKSDLSLVLQHGGNALSYVNDTVGLRQVGLLIIGLYVAAKVGPKIIETAYNHKREFRADEVGYNLSGKEAAIACLVENKKQDLKLQSKIDKVSVKGLRDFIKAKCIYNTFGYTSHPSHDRRIKRIMQLEEGNNPSNLR